MAVVRFNLEPMTSRIPKRTKSVSQSAHDVNPTQVYHALESLGLFKSKAGHSISQVDVQRFAFRSTVTRPFLRISLVYVVGALASCSTSFLHICWERLKSASDGVRLLGTPFGWGTTQLSLVIRSLYEDIQDGATLEEIFPPDTTVGSYRQIERKLKHQRLLKEEYDGR